MEFLNTIMEIWKYVCVRPKTDESFKKKTLKRWHFWLKLTLLEEQWKKKSKK